MSAPPGCPDKIPWGVVFRLLAVEMSHDVNANVGSSMMTLLLPAAGHVEGELPATGVAADDAL